MAKVTYTLFFYFFFFLTERFWICHSGKVVIYSNKSVLLWFTSLSRNQFFPLIDKISFIGSNENLVGHQDLLVDDFHSSAHFYTVILDNNFTIGYCSYNKKMGVQHLLRDQQRDSLYVLLYSFYSFSWEYYDFGGNDFLKWPVPLFLMIRDLYWIGRSEKRLGTNNCWD